MRHTKFERQRRQKSARRAIPFAKVVERWYRLSATLSCELLGCKLQCRQAVCKLNALQVELQATELLLSALQVELQATELLRCKLRCKPHTAGHTASYTLQAES